jgi:hypothetical protein
VGKFPREIKLIWQVATIDLSKHDKAETLLKLTTVSTYAHTNLVAELASELAVSLFSKVPEIFEDMFPNMEPPEIHHEIYTAMRLHDIGKFEVSGAVSQVVRTLFDDEFGQIKSHPSRALRYLDTEEFTCARACACWHHEHFDGTGGYPHDYTDPATEKFRFIAQLCIFADCYSSALDRYKSAYQAEKKPADMVEELKILSHPAASERFRKAEGSVWFNPIFIETLQENTELLKKYSNTEYVSEWIEKAYYNAHLAFQPELQAATESPYSPQALEPYSLTKDTSFQRFKQGASSDAWSILGATKCLMQSANPSVAVVQNPFFPTKNALKFFERKNNWDGFTIMRNAVGWDLDKHTYFIRIMGTAPMGTTMLLIAPDSPWHYLNSTLAGVDDKFEMQSIVSSEIFAKMPGGSPQFWRGINVHTMDCTSDFTICEIKVTRVS